MKTPALLAIALALTSSSLAVQTVSWRDIGTSVQIIGRLGVPIGSVVRIKATVVSGEELRKSRNEFFMYPGRLLRVDEVDGKPCDPSPTMYFQDFSNPLGDSSDSDEPNQAQDAFILQTANGAPIGSVLDLYAFEAACTSVNPPGEVPEDSFTFVSEMKQPDPDARTFLRTRLNVSVIRPPDQPAPPETERRPAHDASSPSDRTGERPAEKK